MQYSPETITSEYRMVLNSDSGDVIKTMRIFSIAATKDSDYSILEQFINDQTSAIPNPQDDTSGKLRFLSDLSSLVFVAKENEAINKHLRHHFFGSSMRQLKLEDRKPLLMLEDEKYQPLVPGV